MILNSILSRIFILKLCTLTSDLLTSYTTHLLLTSNLDKIQFENVIQNEKLKTLASSLILLMSLCIYL
jgi:hypothetical protein